MKYVLLGSISPSWLGKQAERLTKSNEKLKQSNAVADTDERKTVDPELKINAFVILAVIIVVSSVVAVASTIF